VASAASARPSARWWAAGAGAAVFFAPVASATLSSVAPEEHGQASGAARRLGERLGYRRAPEYDFDMAARFGGSGATPVTSVAYLRYLLQPYLTIGRTR